jgi:hypothetical protein
MHPGVRLLAWLAITAALAVATGCVAPRYETMTPAGVVVEKKHAGDVKLDVVGGGGPSFRISDEDFGRAVRDALTASQVFTGGVVDREDAAYRLQAILGDLKQPSAGSNFTAEMHVLWTLWRGGDPVPVWQSLVRSSDTRGMSDALVATMRLQMATDMAARENIAQAIRQLSAANF